MLTNARGEPVIPGVFNGLGCPCPAEKELGPDQCSPSPLCMQEVEKWGGCERRVEEGVQKQQGWPFLGRERGLAARESARRMGTRAPPEGERSPQRCFWVCRETAGSRDRGWKRHC